MMRTIMLATMLALNVGCSGPVPVYLTSHDSAELPNTHPSDEVRELLDEGFGTWGLTYELVGPDSLLTSYGAIDLYITKGSNTTKLAGSHMRMPCRRRIVVEEDPVSLAHELGHAWGLEHDDDEDNVMNVVTRELDITDEQWDDAQRGISNFLACADAIHLQATP